MTFFSPVLNSCDWLVPQSPTQTWKTVVKLNTKQLAADKFYLIFRAKPIEELLIAIALKCLYPDDFLDDSSLGDDLSFSSLSFQDESVAVIAFPLKLLSLCQKIAEMYNMRMLPNYSEIQFSQASLVVKIPETSNILMLRGHRPYDEIRIKEECLQLVSFRNSFLKLVQFDDSETSPVQVPLKEKKESKEPET